MNKLVSSINNLTGKKRYYLSFLLGFFATSALPPVFFLPASVIGFSLLLMQLDACENKKQSVWLGWWFGWGHFISGLYWISIALLTDVAQFGWMMPFAILGIPAILAFYTAIVTYITALFPQKGFRKVIIFAISWTIIEILRGILFTGFPWNLIGYVWTISDAMLQVTSITGIWGLSLISILVFSMPYTILISRDKHTTNRFIPTIIIVLISLCVWGGGHYRLNNTADNELAYSNVVVRIVQGNISQDHKWDALKRDEILRKYFDMSYGPGFEKVNHLLWPESALPYLIDTDSGLLQILKQVIPKGGSLITGSMHAKQTPSGSIDKIWNSVHTIDSDGNIIQIYNKSHLVPFGEYVPFRSILPIKKITAGLADFTKGTGIKTLSIPGLPLFSPLICYEGIFPGQVADRGIYPQMLINVTNDAWYGNSSGPYQHFNMVRVRAVEQGLPLLRAANTGISGAVDAYGRVISKTTLGVEAVLDTTISPALQQKTIYAIYGDKVIYVIIISIIAALLLFPGKSNKDSTTN